MKKVKWLQKPIKGEILTIIRNGVDMLKYLNILKFMNVNRLKWDPDFSHRVQEVIFLYPFIYLSIYFKCVKFGDSISNEFIIKMV